MKRSTLLTIAALAVIFLSSSIFAQGNGQGPRRLNANPDGTPLMTNWVDLDGDGICDNYGTDNQGAGRQANAQGAKMNRKGDTGTGLGLFNGFGDGTVVRPQDGTGFGRGNGTGTGTGTGVCDGTGTGSAGANRGQGRRGNK